MQTKLQLIAAKAADDLQAFIKESEAEITNDMVAAATEAALQEWPCKFRIGFTIVLDLDNSKQDNTLSWTTRHKLSATSEIEDPAQIALLAKK